MFTALKARVFRFVVRRIQLFLVKRGYAVAQSLWVELMTEHLAHVKRMEQMLSRSGEIATLRSKRPRLYKKLMQEVDEMGRKARAVAEALRLDRA